ncbi:MAG: hypothetical protein ACSHX8_08665 [Opitutaceae bacterium]
MKLTYIISLFAAALIFTGCASNKTASTESAPAEQAPAASTGTAKTAYEGSTGSGLLMERYKAGSIEGYRE